ncbi:MAG: restriction endonuclease subunit S [Rhodoferax sp.]|nr:restriction endonuclease subunit S [Rhodoferax sp.]
MNIPSDWVTGLLGDLCSIEIGGTPSRNAPEYWDVAKETNNAWLSIRDLNKRVIHTTSEHISAEGVKNSNVKLQSVGTVLMSFKLSIGRVAYAGIPLYTNEAIAGLRSEVVDHDFLYQGLQHCDLLAGVDQAIKGATLNKAKLKKIKFEYPPSRNEQSKIAEILSTVDQAIEQTEALIAKQQRIKTGLMQDLLTRGIDEHGQLRTEQTHAFKDSPLGRIPVEWEVARLGEVADISAGVTLGKSYEGPDTVALPYLRVANVQDGYLDLSEMKSIRVPNNHLEKYALKVGDVLMNEGGDFDKLGRGAVWRGQVPVCLHQNHVFKVRPHNETLASDFLAAVSESTYGKSFFMMASKQSTNLASINSTQLKAFPIPLPDYQEQIRIQTQFNRLAEVLNGSAAELKKQRSLKVALMQDLLTGRKRVTDLLEPAAA